MAKPAKLVADGVFGPKTRAALCYLAGYTGTTSGSSISAMGAAFLKKWQAYLNSYTARTDWPQMRYGPNSWQCQTIRSHTGGPLALDGAWGPKTRVTTGSWAAYFAAYRRGCSGETFQDFDDVWTTVVHIQAGANGAMGYFPTGY